MRKGETGKPATKPAVKGTVRQSKSGAAVNRVKKSQKPSAKSKKQPKSIVPAGLQSSVYPSQLLAPRTNTVKRIEPGPQPGISITVQIPALRRPKSQKIVQNERKWYANPAVLIPLLAMVVAGSGMGYHVLHKHVAITADSTVSAATRTAPNYQPLIPAEAQATQTDYNGEKNIVSYDTNFGNARVTVSQQVLPANFTTDPNALKRAADSINATQKFDTGHGPVYVADSTTDDSQMGIYATNSVLLFIHTDKKLDAASWKAFIGLLQAKSWQQINQTNKG